MSDSLSTIQLSLIGGGNMARCLVGGLIARGTDPRAITVADCMAAQLEALEKSYGVRVTSDNVSAVRAADVVVLAVKPQELRSVLTETRGALSDRRPLLISIAAGVRAGDIQSWTGVPVVRCMPNRPALHGCGITGLFATADVSAQGRGLAEKILGAVGSTLWLERETDMDTVTAISGSGPAYFFFLIEILEQAGISLGLPADVSRKLAVETAYGSGWMARDTQDSPATMRAQVTSKGGTTEAAFAHLEAHDVRAIFADAIAAAARRSAQLAEELGR